jgi:uncharacterized protein (TIGR00288 family)
MKEHYQGRVFRSATAEPMTHAPNAALLIDFDNVTMGIRSDLQLQLRRLLNSEIIKGKVAVQRAYADWRRYPQYIVPLSEASIDLIFAPAFGSNKKNATDIRLAIDALELVFTRPEIGTFILLSGDSDFSSLVLKLKEYGKYIIGVGIRESSSDLLVQNCDEYYGYTEVTGLTREGDTVTTRRDPWELVVESVLQMKREGDVMRSDRLKQVMQTLDPNFTEKDAGFSRFSRFVVEAGQRGLLQIEKLDNGQYAIDVGSNANVPPGDETQARKPDTAAAETAAPRTRRRRQPRRREEAEPAKERRLTLAEAFELLRQALLVLGAVGEQSAQADDVRAKMVELLGDDGDPLFERPRFQRLLRQAHDANLIELAKGEGDVYQVRLGPQGGEPVVEAAPSPPAKEDAAETSEPPATEQRPRSRRASTRKTSKAKAPAGEAKAPASEVKAPDRRDAKAEDAASAQRAPHTGTSPRNAAPKRNPRFRRGSRGSPGSSKQSAATPAPEDKTAKASSAPSPTAASHGAPTVGRRVGSRGPRRGSARPEEPKRNETGEEKKAATGRAEASVPAERASSPPPPPAPPPPPKESAVAPPRNADVPSDAGGPQAEESSLFKRMSAALQRVVKGPDS